MAEKAKLKLKNVSARVGHLARTFSSRLGLFEKVLTNRNRDNDHCEDEGGCFHIEQVSPPARSVKDVKVFLQLGARAFKVPRSLRRRLWIACIEDKAEVAESVLDYCNFLAQSDSQPANVEIEKDIKRTYPTLDYFASAEGQRALSNVLRAYAAKDPDVGYCQGMNFVAGLLLLYLEDEALTFGALVLLMEHCGLQELYQGLQLLNVQLWHLDQLMLPDLRSQLESSGISHVMYAAPWIITAFSADFPISVSARVMDVLLGGQFEAPVIKVALAMLDHCRDFIRQSSGVDLDLELVLHFLKYELPAWDEPALHGMVTRAFLCPWTEEQLAVLARSDGAETIAQAMERVMDIQDDLCATGTADGEEGQCCVDQQSPTSAPERCGGQDLEPDVMEVQLTSEHHSLTVGAQALAEGQVLSDAAHTPSDPPELLPPSSPSDFDAASDISSSTGNECHRADSLPDVPSSPGAAVCTDGVFPLCQEDLLQVQHAHNHTLLEVCPDLDLAAAPFELPMAAPVVPAVSDASKLAAGVDGSLQYAASDIDIACHGAAAGPADLTETCIVEESGGSGPGVSQMPVDSVDGAPEDHASLQQSSDALPPWLRTRQDGTGLPMPAAIGRVYCAYRYLLETQESVINAPPDPSEELQDPRFRSGVFCHLMDDSEVVSQDKVKPGSVPPHLWHWRRLQRDSVRRARAGLMYYVPAPAYLERYFEEEGELPDPEALVPLTWTPAASVSLVGQSSDTSQGSCPLQLPGLGDLSHDASACASASESMSGSPDRPHSLPELRPPGLGLHGSVSCLSEGRQAGDAVGRTCARRGSTDNGGAHGSLSRLGQRCSLTLETVSASPGRSPLGSCASNFHVEAISPHSGSPGALDRALGHWPAPSSSGSASQAAVSLCAHGLGPGSLLEGPLPATSPVGGIRRSYDSALRTHTVTPVKIVPAHAPYASAFATGFTGVVSPSSFPAIGADFSACMADALPAAAESEPSTHKGPVSAPMLPPMASLTHAHPTPFTKEGWLEAIKPVASVLQASASAAGVSPLKTSMSQTSQDGQPLSSVSARAPRVSQEGCTVPGAPDRLATGALACCGKPPLPPASTCRQSSDGRLHAPLLPPTRLTIITSAGDGAGAGDAACLSTSTATGNAAHVAAPTPAESRLPVACTLPLPPMAPETAEVAPTASRLSSSAWQPAFSVLCSSLGPTGVHGELQPCSSALQTSLDASLASFSSTRSPLIDAASSSPPCTPQGSTCAPSQGGEAACVAHDVREADVMTRTKLPLADAGPLLQDGMHGADVTDADPVDLASSAGVIAADMSIEDVPVRSPSPPQLILSKPKIYLGGMPMFDPAEFMQGELKPQVMSIQVTEQSCGFPLDIACVPASASHSPLSVSLGDKSGALSVPSASQASAPVFRSDGGHLGSSASQSLSAAVLETCHSLPAGAGPCAEAVEANMPWSRGQRADQCQAGGTQALEDLPSQYLPDSALAQHACGRQGQGTLPDGASQAEPSAPRMIESGLTACLEQGRRQSPAPEGFLEVATPPCMPRSLTGPTPSAQACRPRGASLSQPTPFADLPLLACAGNSDVVRTGPAASGGALGARRRASPSLTHLGEAALRLQGPMRNPADAMIDAYLHGGRVAPLVSIRHPLSRHDAQQNACTIPRSPTLSVSLDASSRTSSTHNLTSLSQGLHPGPVTAPAAATDCPVRASAHACGMPLEQPGAPAVHVPVQPGTPSASPFRARTAGCSAEACLRPSASAASSPLPLPLTPAVTSADTPQTRKQPLPRRYAHVDGQGTSSDESSDSSPSIPSPGSNPVSPVTLGCERGFRPQADAAAGSSPLPPRPPQSRPVPRMRSDRFDPSPLYQVDWHHALQGSRYGELFGSSQERDRRSMDSVASGAQSGLPCGSVGASFYGESSVAVSGLATPEVCAPGPGTCMSRGMSLADELEEVE